MKSKVFQLDLSVQMSLVSDDEQHITIPTLDAYSIVESSLNINGLINSEIMGNYSIDGNKIVLKLDGPDDYLIGPDWSVGFTCNYNGILDYERLFAWITDVEVRTRCALLYEELESSFDNRNMLSCALLAGGILEGLLEPSDREDSLYNLIENSQTIESGDIAIAHTIRKMRNVVHPLNRHPYVTREQYLNIVTFIDKMIYKLANLKYF